MRNGTGPEAMLKTQPSNPFHRSPYGEPGATIEPAQLATVPDYVTAALRRARWLLLLPMLANILAFVAGILLLIPLGGPWLFIGFELAVLFGVKKWAESIWKCPSCEKPLGKSLTPPRCLHCGQLFRAGV